MATASKDADSGVHSCQQNSTQRVLVRNVCFKACLRSQEAISTDGKLLVSNSVAGNIRKAPIDLRTNFHTVQRMRFVKSFQSWPTICPVALDLICIASIREDIFRIIDTWAACRGK